MTIIQTLISNCDHHLVVLHFNIHFCRMTHSVKIQFFLVANCTFFCSFIILVRILSYSRSPQSFEAMNFSTFLFPIAKKTNGNNDNNEVNCICQLCTGIPNAFVMTAFAYIVSIQQVRNVSLKIYPSPGNLMQGIARLIQVLKLLWILFVSNAVQHIRISK